MTTPQRSADSDKLATVRHFREMATQRFFERRQLEWRFSFTIWASLTAVAAVVHRDSDAHLSQILIVGIFSLLVVTLHAAIEGVYFVPPAKTDWWEGIERCRTLKELLGEPTDGLPAKCCYRPFFAHWWQLVVSVGLGTSLTLTMWLA